MMQVLKYNSLCHGGTNQNKHETNKNSATILEPASREGPFYSNVLTLACLCNVSISSEIKILKTQKSTLIFRNVNLFLCI